MTGRRIHRSAASRFRVWALGAALLAASLAPASPHHGWSWTESDYVEWQGEIVTVFVGNPHAYLEVEIDGAVWNVELAPPRQTINAGFTEDTASPGDAVTVIGNRSLDPDERRMKAVRITIDGRHYDVYPRRVPTD